MAERGANISTCVVSNRALTFALIRKNTYE